MKNLQIISSMPVPVSNTDWDGVGALIVSTYKKIISQMDVSEKSIKNYISHCALFAQFIETNGFNFNTVLHYKKYLDSLTTIKQGTKRHKLTIAKKLISELKEYGLIDKMKTAKNFEGNTGHLKDGVNGLEIEQIKKYILSIESQQKRTRLNAMFHILALEGLRTFELCQLEIENIDLKNKVWFFRGKKRSESERHFIINDSTIKVIR